jgi:rhamnosyltransferase
MMEVIAGIVLYNPNVNQLQRCIKRLYGQVDKIILFDNSESKRINIEKLLVNNEVSIEYITEKENRGIAYALNRIMEKAKSYGYEWVITLDQDSIVPENMVREYKKYFNTENAGILCPQVIDRRRIYMTLETDDKKLIEVPFCITSGSCTNVDAWEKAGKYDEWLFIDLVDNDFSKRVVLKEFKIWQVNSVILEHEYGEIVQKKRSSAQFYLKISKLLHNENIAKLSYKKKVNPIRIYYTNRNIIYLNKMHRNYGGIGYENYNCKSYLSFFLLFNLASILRGGNKNKIFTAIVEGVHDGRKKAKNIKPFEC